MNITYQKQNGMMYSKKLIEWCAGVLYSNMAKKFKKRRYLEMAKLENSKNTIHVDFGRFLAILEHSA